MAWLRGNGSSDIESLNFFRREGPNSAASATLPRSKTCRQRASLRQTAPRVLHTKFKALKGYSARSACLAWIEKFKALKGYSARSACCSGFDGVLGFGTQHLNLHATACDMLQACVAETHATISLDVRMASSTSAMYSSDSLCFSAAKAFWTWMRAHGSSLVNRALLATSLTSSTLAWHQASESFRRACAILE
jgi:hypothetical protein